MSIKDIGTRLCEQMHKEKSRFDFSEKEIKLLIRILQIQSESRSEEICKPSRKSNV